jgi:uncharacterized protein (TIGR02145 family)
LQVKAGITPEIDIFASGVRLVNVGVDIGGLFKAEATGDFGYCVDNLGESGTWKGEMCFSGGLGAGLVARAAAKVGIEIDTAWKDVSLDLEYSKQIPDEEDIDKEGRHGLWYYESLFDTCEVPTVTSATGRIWMDRNLGASRVATSVDDEQAYGDLYQWGRLADGHEKRTSDTTATKSSEDNPEHSNFITVDEYPYNWRDPENNSLWQGKDGINNPCPAGFRLPTESELYDEWMSWSSKDATGAFASPLKLVVAGFRNYSDGEIIDNDGFVTDEGRSGYYWASTISNGLPRNLDFGKGYSALGGQFAHAKGYSVRCIKD